MSDVYGGCRRVRLWAVPDAAAVLGCSAWSGFSLEPIDGAPFVIGANTLEVEFLDVAVQLGEGEECGEQGCEDGIAHPGQYALAIDGVQVWPDDEPASVTLDGMPYSFDTRMAHVTEACETYASWRSEQQ